MLSAQTYRHRCCSLFHIQVPFPLLGSITHLFSCLAIMSVGSSRHHTQHAQCLPQQVHVLKSLPQVINFLPPAAAAALLESLPQLVDLPAIRQASGSGDSDSAAAAGAAPAATAPASCTYQSCRVTMAAWQGLSGVSRALLGGSSSSAAPRLATIVQQAVQQLYRRLPALPRLYPGEISSLIEAIKSGTVQWRSSDEQPNAAGSALGGEAATRFGELPSVELDIRAANGHSAAMEMMKNAEADLSGLLGVWAAAVACLQRQPPDMIMGLTALDNFGSAKPETSGGRHVIAVLIRSLLVMVGSLPPRELAGCRAAYIKADAAAQLSMGTLVAAASCTGPVTDQMQVLQYLCAAAPVCGSPQSAVTLAGLLATALLPQAFPGALLTSHISSHSHQTIHYVLPYVFGELFQVTAWRHCTEALATPLLQVLGAAGLRQFGDTSQHPALSHSSRITLLCVLLGIRDWLSAGTSGGVNKLCAAAAVQG